MILVTGGAGFIGSQFVHTLLQKGRSCVVLDALTYAGHKINLDGFSRSENFNFVQGNICDADLVRGILQKYSPIAVVHLAAESHVDRSISGPAQFIQTNIVGTYILINECLKYYLKMERAKQNAFRFLHVSTDEVFGELGRTGKFDETTAYRPNSPYSASKASSDFLVRAWNHTYGLPTVITNCSNNYGPRQFPEKLIPLMIQSALSDLPLPVYGDGMNVRDWIYVEDHCEGIYAALVKGKPGLTYCFGGECEKTNLDIVQTLCKILDKLRPRNDGKSHNSKIVFVKDRPGHDFRYAIDCSLAKRELEFKNCYSIEQALEKTVCWYLENQAWLKTVKGGIR